jgi:phage-related protein
MKAAKFHSSVLPILREFPEEARREIGKAIFELQKGEKLTMPLSRPMPDVGSNVHEIRVKDRSGAYRIFYVTVAADGVYIFHAFKKTTQATPKRELDLGKKRLREIYEQTKNS